MFQLGDSILASDNDTMRDLKRKLEQTKNYRQQVPSFVKL